MAASASATVRPREGGRRQGQAGAREGQGQEGGGRDRQVPGASRRRGPVQALAQAGAGPGAPPGGASPSPAASRARSPGLSVPGLPRLHEAGPALGTGR